jgi:integrase
VGRRFNSDLRLAYCARSTGGLRAKKLKVVKKSGQVLGAMKISGLSKHTNGIWYYRPPQIGGIRPRRISLRTRDESTAIQLALDLKRQSSMDISKGSLHGEIERFLRAKEESGDYRPRTQETMAGTLRQFELFAGNPQVTAVTSETIEKWKASMVRKGMSRSGMVAYLRRVQSFFSWLKRAERIAIHPFDTVKIPPIKRTQAITFCSRVERDRLIDACDREDLRCALMCGFFLGLRRMEIVEARPEWFAVPGIVQVAQTATYLPKDAEMRTIHYGERFAAFLADYGRRRPYMLRPDKRPGKANYRWDFRKPWERLTGSLGMEWVTPHVMRHTFASLHVQAGTPIATVADWLGDSVTVTHDHYAALCPTSAHVRNLD